MRIRTVLAGICRAVIFMLVCTVCLWPMAASAHSQNGPSITLDQAQAAFAAQGFQVGPTSDWGWPIPSVRSFVVQDLVTQRVLMVLVFPDVDAATEFRGGIALQQQSSAPDPYVLAGYGPSRWSNNVGMMQSTQSQLERIAQLQADQDNGIDADPNEVLSERAPDIPVDLDFEQALQNMVVNL